MRNLAILVLTVLRFSFLYSQDINTKITLPPDTSVDLNSSNKAKTTKILKMPIVKKIFEIGTYDYDYSEFKVVDSNDEFPWIYDTEKKDSKFPIEINDFARKKIIIQYNLSSQDFNLELLVVSADVHGYDFSIKIYNQIDNQKLQEIGELTFTGQEEKKLIIDKSKISIGKNNLYFITSSPPQTDRWMFWDYISLSYSE